jgi:hypothetical protein
VVVLDEADRLLDAGFADETRRVLALLPRPRQTLLFSATLPDAVRAWRCGADAGAGGDGGSTSLNWLGLASAACPPWLTCRHLPAWPQPLR